MTPANDAGRVLVLGYHRVAALASDPWPLCVSPEHFADQLERICRRGRPLRLRDVAAHALSVKVSRIAPSSLHSMTVIWTL
jgi:hypothetical protein